MWSILDSVARSVLESVSVSGSLVVLLVFFISLEVRLRFALKLTRAADDLLDDAQYAIHDLLNAPAARVAQVQRDFAAWDLAVAAKLDRLHRKRRCIAWHVHHFTWLGTTRPVRSPLGNPQLAGQIATKAKRLKDIAGELYQRASRVWPL